ncbi:MULTISPECIES: cell division protein CrgA [Streptomyces]|uniref:Cell division protein CrgA n=3 Tax=Streptomyces TaxID=1883 RepID=A0A3Q9FUQ8_STRLT|nr:cell division protein CrgA [Streptomyces luteoverticillatus]AZQ72497.1 cell division protein CrgA [Streptomyces luteoverticillatus]
MPKSRIRKKDDFTPPQVKQQSIKLATGRRWVAPLMLAMFLIGLAWIVIFYVTSGDMPVESLKNWNIVVGFGFIAAGFVVSTQWK